MNKVGVVTAVVVTPSVKAREALKSIENGAIRIETGLLMIIFAFVVKSAKPFPNHWKALSPPTR